MTEAFYWTSGDRPWGHSLYLARGAAEETVSVQPCGSGALTRLSPQGLLWKMV